MRNDNPFATPSSPQLVLGIDPGTRNLGFGLVRCFGPTAQPRYVRHGSLRSRLEDSRDRIMEIGKQLEELVKSYSPTTLVLEKAFVSARIGGGGVQTALRLGEARGMVLAVVGSRVKTILELSPREVKQGIAGHGAAGKEQVARMVFRLLGHQDLEESRAAEDLDGTDALALATLGALKGNDSPRRQLDRVLGR